MSNTLQKPRLGTPLNPYHPLARGLVGFWLFNEGSGNKVFDLSGNGLTFSSNIVTNFPTWVMGKYGPSLAFDGPFDNLYLPSTVFPTIPLPWTINFWIRFPVVGSDERVIDFASGRLIFRLAGTVNVMEVYDGSWRQSAVSIAADTWYYMSLVGLSASSCKLYINAVEDNITVDSLSALGGSVGVGAHNTAGSFFGMINLSHFSIYNRALSASEITQHQREPFAMFGDDPIELWAFESGEEPSVTIPVMIHHYKQAGGL